MTSLHDRLVRIVRQRRVELGTPIDAPITQEEWSFANKNQQRQLSGPVSAADNNQRRLALGLPLNRTATAQESLAAIRKAGAPPVRRRPNFGRSASSFASGVFQEPPRQLSDFARYIAEAILIPGEQPIERAVRESRERGEGVSGRLQAMRRAEYPRFIKGATEAIVDPWNYVGIPLIKPLKWGGKGIYRGARALPGFLSRGGRAAPPSTTRPSRQSRYGYTSGEGIPTTTSPFGDRALMGGQSPAPNTLRGSNFPSTSEDIALAMQSKYDRLMPRGRRWDTERLDRLKRQREIWYGPKAADESVQGQLFDVGPEVLPTDKPTLFPQGVVPKAPLSKNLVPANEQALLQSLPADLAGAKPGYSIGGYKYKPKFDSDVDKALFIVARAGIKSKMDASYMDWLKGIFPGTDEGAIRSAGKEVRQHIKDTVSGQPAGDVTIPKSQLVKSLKQPFEDVLGEPPIKPDSQMSLLQDMKVGPLDEATPSNLIPPSDAEGIMKWFSGFLRDPKTAMASEVTEVWRTAERSARVRRVEEMRRALQEMGLSDEEAIKRSKSEFRGELPSKGTELSSEFITDKIRTGLFRHLANLRVDGRWPDGDPFNEFDLVATEDALSRALDGLPINTKKISKDTFTQMDRLQKAFPKDVADYLANPLDLNANISANMKGAGIYPTQLRFVEEAGEFLIDQPPKGTIPVASVDWPIAPWQPRLDHSIKIEGWASVDNEYAAIASDPYYVWKGTPGSRSAEHYINSFMDEVDELGAKQVSLMPDPDRSALVDALGKTGIHGVDLGNLWRSNVSSVDLSWWRQVAPLIFNNSWDFVVANAGAFKALWSDDYAKKVMKSITNDPDYAIYQKADLEFLRLMDSGAGKAAEDFVILQGERPLQRLAQNLPWIRISARAHVTGVNVMTWRIFKSHLKMLRQAQQQAPKSRIGRFAEEAGGYLAFLPRDLVYRPARRAAEFSVDKHAKSFGRMLGDFSGRGLAPGWSKSMTPAISNGLFSFRMLLGRLFTPKHLVSSDPVTRKLAWRNLSTFLAGFSGTLLAGEKAGFWEVDKRTYVTTRNGMKVPNPDFMKVRIGSLRIDPWGGMQQVYRFYSGLVPMLLSGAEWTKEFPFRREEEGLMGTTFERRWERGSMLNVPRQLVEYKMAPMVNLLMEMLEGEDFKGDEVGFMEPRRWIERIAMFSVLDMYEAFEEGGFPLGLTGSVGVVGGGVSAYNNRENISQDIFDVNYDQLDEKYGEKLGAAHRSQINELFLSKEELTNRIFGQDKEFFRLSDNEKKQVEAALQERQDEQRRIGGGGEGPIRIRAGSASASGKTRRGYESLGITVR